MKQYPNPTAKEHQDLIRHGFVMPRTPEKEMTKRQKQSLKEWQEPIEDESDELEVGFNIPD